MESRCNHLPPVKSTLINLVHTLNYVVTKLEEKIIPKINLKIKFTQNLTHTSLFHLEHFILGPLGSLSSSPFLCASPSADQEHREGEIERTDAWPQRVDDLGLSFSCSLLLQSESPFLTHHSEPKKPRGAGPLPLRHQRPHHWPWR